MNSSEYTVTMPFKEFKRWQELEQKFKQLQENIKNCYNIDEETEVVTVQITNLKNIGKELLPGRYHSYNYTEER